MPTLTRSDIAKNPVKAAQSLAVKIDSTVVKKVMSKRPDIQKALGNLREQKRSLLGIERNGLDAIEEREQQIKGFITKVDSLSKGSKYPLFSLEPLKWRNNDGWPRLAVFDVDSPYVKFYVSGRDDGWGNIRYVAGYSPEMPGDIVKCYADVSTKLKTIAKTKRRNVSIEAEFGHMIPSGVRKTIIAAKKKFKQVMVVAEIPKWSLKEKNIARPKPKTADPLIVGYDGCNYWLIDSFDTTSIEHYIKTEFCVKAMPKSITDAHGI